jgi:hypothetical protein
MPPAQLVTKSNLVSLWYAPEVFFTQKEDVLSLTLPLMYFQTGADLSKITHYEVNYQDGFVQRAWLRPEIELFVGPMGAKLQNATSDFFELDLRKNYSPVKWLP